MKTYRSLFTIVGIVFLAMIANAQTNAPSLLGKYTGRTAGDLYGKETVVDIGVNYTASEPNGLRNVFRTDAGSGTWGVTLGAQQFPNKYVGFGFNVGIRDWNNVQPEVLDYAATTFSLRLPLNRIAPGVIGAVGRDWDNGLYYFSVGPRVDVRWNKYLGAFVQTPFIFRTAENRDALEIDFGLSVAFK